MKKEILWYTRVVGLGVTTFILAVLWTQSSEGNCTQAECSDFTSQVSEGK